MSRKLSTSSEEDTVIDLRNPLILGSKEKNDTIEKK